MHRLVIVDIIGMLHLRNHINYTASNQHKIEDEKQNCTYMPELWI